MSQQYLGKHHIYSNQPLMPNFTSDSEENDLMGSDLNRKHSITSSKSNLSETSFDQHSGAKAQKCHQFLVRTFSSPTKCNHCTSLMVS